MHTHLTALAPLDGENALYDAPGVDLFEVLLGEDAGQDDSTHLAWLPFAGGFEQFTAEAAEAVLKAAGYAPAKGAKWTECRDGGEIRVEPIEGEARK